MVFFYKEFAERRGVRRYKALCEGWLLCEVGVRFHPRCAGNGGSTQRFRTKEEKFVAGQCNALRRHADGARYILRSCLTIGEQYPQAMTSRMRGGMCYRTISTTYLARKLQIYRHTISTPKMTRFVHQNLFEQGTTTNRMLYPLRPRPRARHLGHGSISN